MVPLGGGWQHRSDDFNEFVISLMGQLKYDVTFMNNIVRPGGSRLGFRSGTVSCWIPSRPSFIKRSTQRSDRAARPALSYPPTSPNPQPRCPCLHTGGWTGPSLSPHRIPNSTTPFPCRLHTPHPPLTPTPEPCLHTGGWTGPSLSPRRIPISSGHYSVSNPYPLAPASTQVVGRAPACLHTGPMPHPPLTACCLHHALTPTF